MSTGLSRKRRIAIVATAAWLIIVFAISFDLAHGYRRLDTTSFLSNFLGLGALPPLLFWSVAWIRAAPREDEAIQDLLIGIPLESEIFCPRCDALMRLKTTDVGSNAGKVFWGCSRYPKCIQIAPLSAGTLQIGT